MSADIQIAIDADDPHELNRFWAAVMDYAIEDHHDQVTQVLDAGYASVDDTVEIDGRRAWKTAAACRPRTGPGSRLLFQHVPEAKSAKNRVHLDLHVGAGNRDTEVERVIALGTTRLWDGQQGSHTWVTLADPAGNEFCVA